MKEGIVQFIKFNFFGLLNTVLTYCIYSTITHITGMYILGTVADYSFGILFSFFFNKNCTFKNKDKISLFLFLKMIISYIPSFVLNLVGLYIFIEKFCWNKYLSQLLIIIFISVISFFLQKYFVFSLKGKDA